MEETIKDEIKFGTDGWRGIISDNFTFKNVGAVAQAISDWINKDLNGGVEEKKSVAVGYDTRFLSQEYAQAVSCVLAQNDIRVYLSDTSIPTPALSFGVTKDKHGY